MSASTEDSIVKIDPSRVTLAQAREIAAVILESFTGDDVFRSMWGPDYTFPDRPIPVESIPRYNALHTYYSWGFWLDLRNENLRSFTAVSGGKPVGFCMWDVPATEYTYKLSWWHKISDYLIGAWLQVLKVWYFGFWFNPLLMPTELKDCEQEFRKINNLAHENPDKRRVELSQMSNDELAEQRYLLEDYYWCRLVGIVPSHRRKGLGGLMFRESIKGLLTRDMVLNGKVLPARLGILASDMGRPVYARAGFKPFSSLVADYKGEKVAATPMEKILYREY